MCCTAHAQLLLRLTMQLDYEASVASRVSEFKDDTLGALATLLQVSRT